jgi:hypothetical protein
MNAAALEVARLVLRQESSPPEEMPNEAIQCEGSNSYDGRMGVRISAIFVILVGSLFGMPFDSTTVSSACTNSNQAPSSPRLRSEAGLN